MNKFLRTACFYILIAFIVIIAFEQISKGNTTKNEINYTAFIQQLDAKAVKQVTIVENTIKGVLTDGTEFTTIAPDDPTLIGSLREKGVDIKAERPPEPSWWTTILSSILPMLLLIGVWFFIMQQSQGGGSRVMSFGKSRAKLNGDGKVKVTFKDVAGADEAKQELEEVVEFLKHPKKFNDLGARIPKGVLLFGPPGTGKTLLAKAVAGEAGVPFFTISGSDFVEMFVGVGASRVRDLFEQAKKNAPCIVFIDEIDAVGRQRGTGVGGGHDEREQTLNQLLVEMDGFAANEGIIIIAATNRPDVLDPALLRPGRFDRQIVVDKPDVKGRNEILKVHVKGKPVADDANLDVLARRTPGFTGADLSNLVNEAALLSARRNKKKIYMSELEESIERVIAGPERKSKVISDKEKRLTAYHEAGHTLVGMLLPNANPVHKVTIIPRGRAGGYTLSLPKEEYSYQTRSQLLDELQTFLGGRVAEEVVLKEISTGAYSDIERASALVRSMITQYGMSDALGPIAFGKSNNHQVFLGRDFNHERNYSEEVASEIDREVRRCIDDAYRKCRKLLEDNIDKLHLIANALIERETLDADELKQLVEKGSIDEKPKDNDDQGPTPAMKKIEDAVPAAQAEPSGEGVTLEKQKETQVPEPKLDLNITTKQFSETQQGPKINFISRK